MCGMGDGVTCRSLVTGIPQPLCESVRVGTEGRSGFTPLLDKLHDVLPLPEEPDGDSPDARLRRVFVTDSVR
jgi:hypothetical protein